MRLLAFLIAFTMAFPALAADRCRETTLPGAWKSPKSGNIWTFHADGALSCDGPCRFTQVTGDPISWAYEPHANVWSRPIEHVKLEFANIVFDGVFGSFRCQIEDEGATLRLIGEDEEQMVFTRQ